MAKPLLIIITGLPGTGKTSLGKKISAKFQLPLICKDDIKEILFDSLGYQDRAWSQKIGGASYDLLYHLTAENLRAKKSIIIETNFDPRFAKQKILALKKKYDFKVIQLRCWADGEILFARFKKRAVSGRRHPGHLDAENSEAWCADLVKGKIDALKIGGQLIDIDTTQFRKINYPAIFAAIKKML